MPTPPPNNAVIIERLENLRCDVQSLSMQVQKFTDRFASLETRYIEGHIPLVDKLNEHDKRLQRVESELSDLVKVSQSQEHRLKWISSILGLIGTSVILYMVGIVLPRLFGS
jgi:hypothetical protein